MNDNVASANAEAKSSLLTTSAVSSPSPAHASVVTTTVANNTTSSTPVEANKTQPKRLHVSNIPFRFRDPDLRAMFGVCRLIIINPAFNIFLFAFSNLEQFWMSRLYSTREEVKDLDLSQW